MIDLNDLNAPVSFCGGGGGGGGGGGSSRPSSQGGRDGYAVKGEFHGTNLGRDLGYNGGYNSNDPQGAWGRPDLSEGDAYSGDQSYGWADGR